MAQVACDLKVYPVDVTKLDELRKEVSKQLNIVGIQELDIGFGIKLLKVVALFDDSQGGDIEAIVGKIPGVSQVEVDSMNRL